MMEGPPHQAQRATDVVQALGEDFRRHLETFYSRLKLAPPYHTVEKAIQHLTTNLKEMTPAEREQVAGDPSLRWAQYQAAFVSSGLNQKHRGIIAGLARSPAAADLPVEYGPFLDSFLS